MDRDTDEAPVASGGQNDHEHDRLETHSAAEAAAAPAPVQIAQANGEGGTTPATETTETPPAHKLNVPLPNAPVTATFTASEGARIVLPEGATVDTIMVRGNDLILVQADGSIILIVDGAKYPPELVVAGIDIPADQLAQIVHNVPEGVPAAGPEAGGEHTPSSGGNFAGPPGDIGDPFPIGPLLPPTELHFGLPEVKEIVPGLLQAAAPPDLFPVQVEGATVNGVVEEEQFTGNEQQSGAGIRAMRTPEMPTASIPTGPVRRSRSRCTERS